MAFAMLSIPPSSRSSVTTFAELPRVSVDASVPPVTGTSRNAATAAEFATALGLSSLGDEIVLTADSVGPITLTERSGTGWITIRSNNSGSLPAYGTRVGAADSANMRKITGGGTPVRCVVTSGIAHHYRFIGVEFLAPTTPISTGLIVLGAFNETLEANLPHHIIFDRCLIRGDATIGCRRGINFGCGTWAAVHCYIGDMKESGADSQAILCYNSPGPGLIWNCFLEGAGENVMFGGGDPTVTNMIPSDIELRGNYFYKPTAWVGSGWTVKNHFELKMGVRILLHRCQFSNMWAAAQAYSVNIKVANQDGTATWAATNNVTLSHNKFTNVENGIVLNAKDPGTSLALHHALVENNIFEIENVTAVADYRGFMVLGLETDGIGPMDIAFRHNTWANRSGVSGQAAYIEAYAVDVMDRLYFENNAIYAGTTDIDGPVVAAGQPTFDRWSITNSVINNAIIGSTATYGASNIKPVDVAAMKYTDHAARNYILASDSPGKNAASDGVDMGASVALVESYAASAVAGTG